ncbi:MAG: alpha/beta hydrolase [Pseudolysinimonas sp.]
MPVHPWIAERFALIRDIPSFDAAFGDPHFAAGWVAFNEDPERWTPPAGVITEEAVADGPHGPVPLVIFRPATRAATPTSALLWMHGGGFVVGTARDPESVIPGTELAARAGAVVVSVDYRLAVDGVQYPVPLDDVSAAWAWLTQHASELGVDPHRLFIGGASAGANLAISAAVRLRDAGEPVPRGMLLGYPLAHFPVPPITPAFARELDDIPPMLRFPVEYQLGIVHNYIGRFDNLPADVAPGNYDVGGLPEAWIAPDEYDDLRAAGEVLADQLAAAGIPVHLELARGMVHGHLGRSPSLEPVDQTLDFFAAALR